MKNIFKEHCPYYFSVCLKHITLLKIRKTNFYQEQQNKKTNNKHHVTQ
jgi:hypothetical protein